MNLSALVKNVLYIGGRPAIWVLFHLLVWREPRTRVGPFDVIALSDCDDIESHVAKFAEAADLLQQCDPIRFRRIAHTIRLIVVYDYTRGFEAEYHHFARAMVMQTRVLKLCHAEAVAAVLAHEATHGRLDDMGIWQHHGIRERVERICLRNEVWCLEKLPGAGQLLQTKKDSLARGDVM